MPFEFEEEEAWIKLVRRFANGRDLCNCKYAYYTNCGIGSVHKKDGTWEERTDLPACKFGCQANKYRTQMEIGYRVLQELKERDVNAR